MTVKRKVVMIGVIIVTVAQSFAMASEITNPLSDNFHNTNRQMNSYPFSDSTVEEISEDHKSDETTTDQGKENDANAEQEGDSFEPMPTENNNAPENADGKNELLDIDNNLEEQDHDMQEIEPDGDTSIRDDKHADKEGDSSVEDVDPVENNNPPEQDIDAEAAHQEETVTHPESDSTNEETRFPEEPYKEQQFGLIDVGLLTNTKLEATHTTLSDGKEKITLNFEGEGVLNLNVLKQTIVTFQVPQEIGRLMKKGQMKAYYDVPSLGILGIVIRHKGEFAGNQMTVSGNQITLNFTNYLSLQLLSKSYFKFRLEITLDEMPISENPYYQFYAEVTENPIVDISILESPPAATDRIDTPKVLLFYSIPETLQFETTMIEPKFSTITRSDPHWKLEVLDTRGEGSAWRITAKTDQPLTSTTNSSHILQDALVYVDEQQNSYSLTQEAVEVYDGTTGGHSITSVNWTKNTGLLLKFYLPNAFPEQYVTTIDWTLVDAP